MTTDTPTPVRRRRSGEKLEGALLDAAWDELVEVGYGRLTMATIAARAGTSEPVLYRRWPNKDRVVLAALERQRARHPIAVPDTGSLRGDLLEQLTTVGTALAGFYAIAAAASFAGLLADTGMTPTQVREHVMAPEGDAAVRAIFCRAAERGELDLGAVPRAVLEMPFDLVRHDLLMSLEVPGPERIRSIVDDLFLPLVRRG
ncbi:TetR/AcrR family transcriptional regulator [Frondihabitans australicus]|uniref:TetR family transcriptional regulator n=1 Tax=Frondihabitans australicus TaxID=386892 RepID=A0A495IKG9_9MICO|nr:TetR/AcrR family transcriptional regulator [Frondihabitans australicus]RKR76464.1 TetR family transcriptional regulator [Frondihabitans australicus]